MDRLLLGVSKQSQMSQNLLLHMATTALEQSAVSQATPNLKGRYDLAQDKTSGRKIQPFYKPEASMSRNAGDAG